MAVTVARFTSDSPAVLSASHKAVNVVLSDAPVKVAPVTVARENNLDIDKSSQFYSGGSAYGGSGDIDKPG